MSAPLSTAAAPDPADAEALGTRERLARDLHDGLARDLAVIRLLARPGLSPEEAQRVIGEVATLAERSLMHVRTLIADLRERSDAALGPLLARDLAPLSRQAGAHVRVLVDTQLELPVAVRTAIRRIAREAVANALLRGRASHVEVRLLDQAQLVLAVGDDGIGFDPRAARPATSCGLDWMRAEAEAAGGDLHIDSAPGRGTTVTVRFACDRRP